jgi:shikimate kinase
MSATGKRIIITGFMAAGKSTVAAALSRRLECQTIDLDFIISEHEKRSVPSLIKEEGEERFREVEHRVLGVVLGTNRARVIALGGGAWTLPENRALIADHDCLTVWLDAPFDLCWRRIVAGEEVRPLAQNQEAARRLFDERRPLYALAALHVSVTPEKSAEEIATEIIHAL